VHEFLVFFFIEISNLVLTHPKIDIKQLHIVSRNLELDTENPFQTRNRILHISVNHNPKNFLWKCGVYSEFLNSFLFHYK
jgi:hypothetical protein